MKTKLPIILSLALVIHAYAGSATWNLNPTSNDWNTATNWTPATVPNATTDIATFGASNTTSVVTSANVDLASLVFTADAPSDTIDAGRDLTLTFWGEGVRNDSGVQQTFIAEITQSGFSFNGNSSAGDNLTYQDGSLSFHDDASAGSASFRDTGIDFFDNASADHGVFANADIVFDNNSTAANGTFSGGGHVDFFGTSSAGDANFTLSGGAVVLNMLGGTLSNATVTVNGGNSFADT